MLTQWRNRLRITSFSGRIYAGLILLFLGFVPVLVAAFFSLRQIVAERKELVSHYAQGLILAERLQLEARAQYSLVPVFVLSGHARLVKEIQGSHQKFDAILAELRDHSPGDQALLDRVEKAEAEQRKRLGPGLAMRQRGDSAMAVHRYFTNSQPPWAESLSAALEELVQKKSVEFRDAKADMGLATDRVFTGLGVVSTFAFAFLAWVTVLLFRAVRTKARADLEQTQLFLREKQISRVRKETVEIVSHDLKSPLAALKLRLQLMLRKTEVDPKTWAADLHHLLQSTTGMQRLIQDYLDDTKAQSGQAPLRPEPCDVATLTRNLREEFSPLAYEKQILLSSQCPENLPALLADPARLAQALGNLLGNALKFTPPGGTVQLRAHWHKDECEFSVSDSGPGIPPAKLPKVFERYWQEESTASLGTGLGLAITKEIVHAHGGQLTAESPAGAGATFRIRIPFSGPDSLR